MRLIPALKKEPSKVWKSPNADPPESIAHIPIKFEQLSPVLPKLSYGLAVVAVVAVLAVAPPRHPHLRAIHSNAHNARCTSSNTPKPTPTLADVPASPAHHAFPTAPIQSPALPARLSLSTPDPPPSLSARPRPRFPPAQYLTHAPAATAAASSLATVLTADNQPATSPLPHRTASNSSPSPSTPPPSPVRTPPHLSASPAGPRRTAGMESSGMDALARGAPLQNVMLLLLASVLYERYLRPQGRATVETPWWAVYVLSAPLLFGDVRPIAAVPPLVGLFCTRFVVEALSGASDHWAVAVSAPGKERPRAAIAREALARYQPLLPD